jgi:signal transduction histidine kinase
MSGRTTFKVSAALKRLIGRDLITNASVAVFELVKNGFDARATRVDLYFLANRLIVVDDGSGMTEADIENKWLFVAYSQKKESGAEPRGPSDRLLAGSKGVGRFAADQLGSRLELQTKQSRAKSVEVVDVLWDEFERDQMDEFVDVHIARRQLTDFALPEGCAAPTHGTALVISGLRQEWSRDDLIKLRRHLTRLIDPFAESRSEFEIFMHAPAEAERDTTQLAAQSADEDQDKSTTPHIVNGRIGSNLQELLADGTTSIHVCITGDGGEITTTLSDRGVLIYKLAEPNRYDTLRVSEFDCKLFYLNRAAKMRFARRMGIAAVEFGSVFLFRNGFRVFPIGEVANDFFGIERRKQQGFSRYLGTRDVIGRINVRARDDAFQESTSRDQGLIQTRAVEELRDCFNQCAFKRLETYVTGVAWTDKQDQNELGPSRMRLPEAREKLVGVLAGLTKAEGATLLDVATDLSELLDAKLGNEDPTLKGLEAIAKNRQDAKLLKEVGKARTRLRELARARVSAVSDRDKAIEAAEQAESARRHAQEEVDRAHAALDEEKKRALFLEASAPLETTLLQALLHQVGIQASDVAATTRNAIRAIHEPDIDRDALESMLAHILWCAQQALAVTRFATKANFRLDAEESEVDLGQFMREYLERVARVWQDIRIDVSGTPRPLTKKVRPIDLSIVLDNLVANAKRARATVVSVEMTSSPDADAPELRVRVHDNGRGLSKSVNDPARLFERGFSTTEGSGLGLWHVQKAVTDLGGSITAEVDQSGRLVFEMVFR